MTFINLSIINKTNIILLAKITKFDLEICSRLIDVSSIFTQNNAKESDLGCW